MCAIAVNTLYTTLRKRGTTRQLAGAIITCVISALFLLPALFWYNLRFGAPHIPPPTVEIEIALAYIALCGWMLPLGTTTTYWLFSLPRNSNTDFRIPSQPRQQSIPGKGQSDIQDQATNRLTPLPHHQPGAVVPFVYEDEAPWGWLEYSSGSFQGQRLALKRTNATLGRDEECDIWLDDEAASRYHAELVWMEGQSYLVDRGSMNGVLLNRERVQGSVPIRTNDMIEIGSQRFLFILAEQHKIAWKDEDDPLSRHTWRSTRDLFGNTNQQETLELEPAAPRASVPNNNGGLTICDGDLAGCNILLDRPVLTLGRGPECHIVINEVSISRQHAQFLCQVDGDYVQDLSSRNGTTVNGEALPAPRRLLPGDVIGLGNLHLLYITVNNAPETPLPNVITPQPYPSLLSGPLPLKLPSRMK